MQEVRRYEPEGSHVLETVLGAIERVIGHAIDKDQPLTEAGLDSLGAVELRQNLETDCNVQLPATVAFDYPTPIAMAQFIASLQGADHSG